MERVIKKELVGHLEGQGLLRNSQHEFRAGKCLSNLLGFMGDASEKIERGGKADMVFLDFKKTFDTVPHARLMVKLVSCSWRGGEVTKVDRRMAKGKKSEGGCWWGVIWLDGSD